MKSRTIRIFLFVLLFAGISVIGTVIYKLRSRPFQSEPQVMVTLTTKALENLFGDSSCMWPCWQGITPGVTTSDEALNMLNKSPIIQNNSIHLSQLSSEFDSINWHWKLDNRQSEDMGLARSHNGIVYEIQLNTYHNVSIGEVINRFGPPEKVNVIDCTDVPEGEFQYWCGILYYTKSGFNIHGSWTGSWVEHDLQITQFDPIKFIVLFTPSTIEEWSSSKGLDISSLNLRDWKGYGNLYDLYVK